MDFKTLLFIFPRPLTREEVDMLTEAGQAIGEGAKKRMNETARNLKIMGFANKAASLHADRFAMAATNFNHFFRLSHPAPDTYMVMMDNNLFAFMDIKLAGIKLADFQEQLLARTERFFFKRPIRDMGFSKDQVRVERGTAQID